MHFLYIIAFPVYNYPIAMSAIILYIIALHAFPEICLFASLTVMLQGCPLSEPGGQ